MSDGTIQDSRMPSVHTAYNIMLQALDPELLKGIGQVIHEPPPIDVSEKWGYIKVRNPIQMRREHQYDLSLFDQAWNEYVLFVDLREHEQRPQKGDIVDFRLKRAKVTVDLGDGNKASKEVVVAVINKEKEC